MSLHPEDPTSPPEETRRVARAAFPKGTLCLDIADALGPIYQDSQFAGLFPQLGQPAAAPAMLALATVLQYLEGLSDRQAADAVRGRIDWKYALRLPLTDPGFDHTVLSEFRSRLVEGKAEQQLLDTLLDRLRDLGLVKPRGPSADGLHARARRRARPQPSRAGRRDPARGAERSGGDGAGLAAGPGAGRVVRALRPPGRELSPAQDRRGASGAGGGHRGRWPDAAAGDRPGDRPALAGADPGGAGAAPGLGRAVSSSGTARCAGARSRRCRRPPPMISSPYDTDARYSTKRESSWVGYKVHLTETCDADAPHVIVNVETTAATTPDDNMLAVIHKSLESRDLLPAEHLVDKGYTDSRVLVDSQRDYGVTIIGPVADDPSWQARAEEGFDKSQFVVDWDRQGDVPGRQAEHLLAAQHLSEERHGVRGAVRPPGLYAVPAAVPLHPVQARAAHHRAAGARAPRGPASRPQTAGYGGVPGGLCRPGRHRGNARTGGSPMRLAALPLYRAGQNPPAAPHQRCRHQPGADRKLGERHPDRPDPLLMVRRPSESRMTAGK